MAERVIKDKTLLSVNDLRAAFEYCPHNGTFKWRSGMRLAGHPAGHPNGYGYVILKYRRRTYLAHRVAWAISHGRWPEHFVDHKDGNRANNRLSNLREATNLGNGRNRRVNKTSMTGLKGVNPRKNRISFGARIRFNGKNHYLGTFRTAEEAHEFYCLAADLLHGEFASHG